MLEVVMCFPYMAVFLLYLSLRGLDDGNLDYRSSGTAPHP